MSYVETFCSAVVSVDTTTICCSIDQCYSVNMNIKTKNDNYIERRCEANVLQKTKSFSTEYCNDGRMPS